MLAIDARERLSTVGTLYDFSHGEDVLMIVALLVLLVCQAT